MHLSILLFRWNLYGSFKYSKNSSEVKKTVDITNFIGFIRTPANFKTHQHNILHPRINMLSTRAGIKVEVDTKIKRELCHRSNFVCHMHDGRGKLVLVY